MPADDSTSMTPARQVVDLFRPSPANLPSREDFDIAASVLFSEPEVCADMYDIASAVRSAPVASSRMVADFASIRAFAYGHIEFGDLAPLASSVGGTLPHGCAVRVAAASSDPDLSRHLLATAADHFAEDTLESLRILTGAIGREVVVDVADPSLKARMASTPFFCHLRESGTAHA